MPARPARAHRGASAALLTFAACQNSHSTANGHTAPSHRGENAPADSTAAVLPPSSVLSVPPVPASGCPAIGGAAGPGTVHRARVERDETWTPEGSPHRFPDGLTIEPGASVTVVPCTSLRFAADRALFVGPRAALIIEGEAGRPVRLGPDAEPRAGAWVGLVFAADARRSSRIQHAVIEGAGAGPAADAACIRDAMPALDLAYVSLERCRGRGVLLLPGGSFREQSEALTVRGTVAADGLAGTPIVFADANAVGSLPTTLLADNADPRIEITATGASHLVQESARWRNPGVPYDVPSPDGLEIRGPANPVLKLDPGVEIRLAPGAQLRVGVATPGGLIARANGEAHVLFTQRASGGWAGLVLGARAIPSSVRLDHLVIAHASSPTVAELCPDAGSGGLPASAIHWGFPPATNALVHVRVVDLPTGTVALSAEWPGTVRSFEANALDEPDLASGMRCWTAPSPRADGGCFPAAPCAPGS